ncbi:MAG: hypothetical protein ACREQI_10790 [Candidatus Binataceae bacterium]
MIKNTLKLTAAVGLLLALAAPAGAQYYGLPRTGEWNNFLAHHRKVAGMLQSDPCMMSRPGWRQNHPELHKFLLNHPHEATQLKLNASQYCRGGRYSGPGYGGPGYGHHGWGDYDAHHEWHDYNWWHEHHPNWVRQHHPEWSHMAKPGVPHPMTARPEAHAMPMPHAEHHAEHGHAAGYKGEHSHGEANAHGHHEQQH